MKIKLKSARELDLMRAANRLARKILLRLGQEVKPGVTTRELDELARELSREAGATPAFLGYPGAHRPFPAAICASVNNVVIHGVPNGKPLQEGDILGIDYGCILDGYVGDTAWTFPVGWISESAQFLMDVTRTALFKGIEQAVVGNRVRDISRAVQRYVESHGCGAVRALVGHGVGRTLHEDPPVPNYVAAEFSPRLKAGMTLAIEPMITLGSYEVATLDDGWTIVTKDGSWAAHFEHSVAILPDGPEILSVDP
jgi:methionyl aminopeptidase